jgi:hypothetical protein
MYVPRGQLCVENLQALHNSAMNYELLAGESDIDIGPPHLAATSVKLLVPKNLFDRAVLILVSSDSVTWY